MQQAIGGGHIVKNSAPPFVPAEAAWDSSTVCWDEMDLWTDPAGIFGALYPA